MSSPLSFWLLNGVPCFPFNYEELQNIRRSVERATRDLDNCRLRLELGTNDIDSTLAVTAEIQSRISAVTPDLIRVRESLEAIYNLEKRNAYVDMVFHRLRNMQLVVVAMVLGFELLVPSNGVLVWVVTKSVPLLAFAFNFAHLFPGGNNGLEYLADLQKTLRRSFFIEMLLNCSSLMFYSISRGPRTIALSAAYVALFLGVCYVNKLRFVELFKVAKTN